MIMKLNMVLNMRAVQGVLMLKTILRRINVSRELFILRLEYGDDVFIPKDMSYDNWPQQFRFYDSILCIVQ